MYFLSMPPIFNVLANIGTLWLLYNLLDSAFCGCLCSACTLFRPKSCQQMLKLDQPSSEPVKIVLFMPNSGVPKDPDPCLPGEQRQIKSLPPSPLLHSLVEMKVWRLWLLLSSCSLVIARVQSAAPADFLHRFRANLANFDSLNLNSNSLTTLANLEAAEVCQDVSNTNKVRTDTGHLVVQICYS